MANYDWSRFSQKTRLNVPVEKVYNAWTTRKGLESWFLRMAEFTTPAGRIRHPEENIQEGDSYIWMWHGYPDSVNETGAILEANGTDQIRFSFGKAGNVTVKIIPEGNDTWLHITQEDIPTDEESKVQYHMGCQTGWTFYRANIKTVLEGITDARNKQNNQDNID